KIEITDSNNGIEISTTSKENDIAIKDQKEGGVLLLKCIDNISKKSIAFRVNEEKNKTNGIEMSTTSKENEIVIWDQSIKCEGEKGGYTQRAHGDEYQLIVIMVLLMNG
ncbi:hypothetical protein B566_EDAN012643, partial [Ephemera danica]